MLPHISFFFSLCKLHFSLFSFPLFLHIFLVYYFCLFIYQFVYLFISIFQSVVSPWSVYWAIYIFISSLNCSFSSPFLQLFSLFRLFYSALLLFLSPFLSPISSINLFISVLNYFCFVNFFLVHIFVVCLCVLCECESFDGIHLILCVFFPSFLLFSFISFFCCPCDNIFCTLCVSICQIDDIFTPYHSFLCHYSLMMMYCLLYI